MIASDYRGARALDRYWDGLAAGARTPDSGLAETVRRLHDDDFAPRPESRFTTRLREDLMDRAVQAQAFPPASAAGGRAEPLRPGSDLPAPWHGRRTWRWLTQDAIAVAVVLVLVFGVVAREGNFAGLLDFRQDVPGETAMLQGDAARTGEMPGPLPAGQPGLLWRIAAGSWDGTPASSPVVADGVVYLSGTVRQADSTFSSPALLAIDLATGVERWRLAISGLGVLGTLAVSDGTVYAGISGTDVSATPTAAGWFDSGGYLVAIDAATGVERWRVETGEAANQSPVVVDGVVYISAGSGNVHAVDAKTGDLKWTFTVPNTGELLTAASPAVADGLVFIATNRGILYAIDAENGAERWHATVGGESPATPVVSDGVVYVGADQATGTINPNSVSGMMASTSGPVASPGAFLLFAFDVRDGSLRWSIDLGPALKGVEPSPAVVAGSIVVAGVGDDWREVRALDPADGRERWHFTADQTVNVSPTVADGTVVVGSFGGFVYALSLETGQALWRVETGGGIVTPAYLDDGAVIVGSADGNLYAIGGTASGPGTPVATPVDGSDLSGMPPCEVEPRPTVVPEPTPIEYATPIADASVTPAASLVPVTRQQRYGDVPGMTWEKVPTGAPADAEAISGITATIDQMIACDRPGREAELAALYSDDFYRRPWVMAYIRYNVFWTWAPSPARGPDMTIKETIALPDGRVAVVFSYQGDDAEYGYLVAFVEQDGRWLVDELIEISPFGDGVG